MSACPRCGTELHPVVHSWGQYEADERGYGAKPHTPDRCADVLKGKLGEALELAYIGEHHFPDQSWKARCGELVVDNEALTRRVAELEEAAKAVTDYVLDEAVFPLRYEGRFREVIAALAASQAPRKEGET
jgi:hypothetical protein